MDYILTDNGELYHYGVKGMKWGVRRAQKRLSSASTRDERAAAVSSLKKHKQKGSAKLEKLQNKTAKLEKRANDTRLKYESKAPGMRATAARKRAKSYGLLNTDLSVWSRRKAAARLEAKAAGLESTAMKAKLKLEKNQRMIKAFQTEISKIDKTLAESGRRYING